MVRRDAERPDYALFVVALLDQRAHDASNADTIAAHEKWVRVALCVQVHGAKDFGVAAANLKDVADLGAALSLQLTATARTSSACAGGGDILPAFHVKVSRIVDISEMIVNAVGPGDKVIAHLQRGIGHDEDILAFVQRRGKAGHDSSIRQFFGAGQVQVGSIEAGPIESGG